MKINLSKLLNKNVAGTSFINDYLTKGTFMKNFNTKITHETSPHYHSNKSGLLNTQKIWLENEKINIRYAQLGNLGNPPIILLHGVPENLQAWYGVAPLLAKHFNVLAIDLPGFGGSDGFASHNEYNSHHFAQVVVAFMDALNIDKASLVASDISLLPALLVGLKSPNRVNKLVVMDGIPFFRPQYSSWELKSFAKKGSIIGKALVEWFPYVSAHIAYFKGFYRGHSIPLAIKHEFLSDGKSKTNQLAFLAYFQNFTIGQEYFEKHVGNLKKEVLVLWGKQDRFIDKKLAIEIDQLLPNSRLDIIDKAGHYLHMDRPEIVAKKTIEFLNY